MAPPLKLATLGLLAILWLAAPCVAADRVSGGTAEILRRIHAPQFPQRDNDGRRIGVPTENVIIRRCSMKDGHGGVTIGSEISGDCRNVFVEACKMDSPNLDRAFRFKSNAMRGGVIENVFVRNVEIGRVARAVLSVEFDYEEGAHGPFPPTLRNVQIQNVTGASSARVCSIAGFPKAVIEGVLLQDCAFRGVEAADILRNAGSIEFRNVTIEPAKKEKP